MNTRSLLVLCGAMLGWSIAGHVPASARMEEWKDTQGNTFTAEPVEALGPLAVFRNEKRWARLLPFSSLPAEECVRFHAQAVNREPPAALWEHATSEFSRDTFRYALQLETDELKPAWLKGRPEPAFQIVIYGSSRVSKSWDSIDVLLPLYTKLKEVYGSRIEAIFYGLNHEASDQSDMAVKKNMPWLVADFYQQGHMETLRQFAPGSKAGVLVLSHDGMPYFAADISQSEQIAQPLLELAALLEATRPENPKGWKSRAHYLRAVQPVIHASSRSEPVMVGNPLQVEGLRQRKVFLVEATLTVSEEGKVTAADVKPDAANLPAAMMAPIASALQKSAIFVPAVDHGKFIEATYLYRLEVPR